ncbi:hypothetical protein [Streptomyces sclerotialus]|uniref:hypothetical protein n=1 Tax=Streptomyces sclerotialus TaxID=1957 RepID=UPI00068BFC5E
MRRVWHLDLTGRHGDQARIGTWNPLGAERGQDPERVQQAVVDACASVLGWSDATHPRALTVLTKCVEALVEVNRQAVAEQHPERQTTLLQVPTLLGDALFRAWVIGSLPAETARW